MTTFIFQHIACGGTFDYFHKGHEKFLNTAFSKSAQVSIGLTSDLMAKTSGKEDVRSYDIRLAELTDFLTDNFDDRYKIFPLDDIYGTTLTDETLEGMMVTDSTLKNAQHINEKRKAVGLQILQFIPCHDVLAQDGKPISTRRIKTGVIDRTGFSYSLFLKNADKFVLPGELRGALRKPFGKLSPTFDIAWKPDNALFVTVGDQVTIDAVKNHIIPDLSVIDFVIERKKRINSIKELGFTNSVKVVEVENPAGTIQKSLIHALTAYFAGEKQVTVLRVNGEEDLAVLPVVLLAPLATRIIYGQQGEGVVAVIVTEEKKQEALSLIKHFVTNF